MVGLQARRLQSQRLQLEAVFSTHVNVKTLNIFKETSGRSPAVFLVTQTGRRSQNMTTALSPHKTERFTWINIKLLNEET